MSKKVFIINAPPQSGKDTLANGLQDMFGFVHVRFKTALYEIMKTMYGMHDCDIERYSHKDRKDRKGKFYHGEDGRSFREHLIEVSEDLIKPVFGNDYFGKALADEIEGTPGELFVVSDGGFVEEVEAVVQRFGKENVFCVYIVNPTVKSFEDSGDSRRSLPPDMFGDNMLVSNDPRTMTQHQFIDEVGHKLQEILNNKENGMKVLDKTGKEVEIEQQTYKNSVEMSHRLAGYTYLEYVKMEDPQHMFPTQEELDEKMRSQDKQSVVLEAGQDMAMMMASMSAHVKAHEAFTDDIDIIAIMSKAATDNGYYSKPDRFEVVVRKDKVSTVLRFKHRKESGYTVVEHINKFGELNQRHMTIRTFFKDKGELKESLTEFTPTSIQDVQDAAYSVFSNEEITPVIAERTARRHMLAMKTDSNPTELN